MSTKTNFKRVALVAVASLGLGVLTSIAPASAVVIVADDVALTVAAATVDTFGTCAAGTNTTTQVAATPQVMTLGAHQTFTISNNADAVLTITGPAKWIGKRVSDGALNYTNPTQTATYTVNGDQKVATIGATGAYVLEVTGAGSIIVTAAASAAAPTALNTWYLLGATACSNSVSVANSFVQVTNAVGNVMTQANINTLNSSQYDNAVATGGSAAGLDTSSDVITTFANDGVAYIAVAAKDAYTYALAGSTNLLMIQCDNGAKVNSTIYPYYSNASFAASTTTANIPVRQATSGVSMVTTCAVSVNGVALASKKITFAGDVATITIAASRNGDVDNGTDSRFSYVYKDSAGNALTAALPSLTASTASASTTSISAYSSSTFYNSSVAYAGAKGAGSNPLYKTSGYAVFNCLDYGTTSISVYAYNAAGTKITSNVLPVICGGAIDTYTASLDKATYQAGDIATLTITAKSAGGTPTGYAVTPGAGFSVAMPGMTAVVAPTTADTESVARAGVWTYTYTVNSVEGKYNGAIKIAVASTSAQYGKAATVAYTISPNGSVSNADVLKAIVSLIASINKQIAALQKALLKK